MILLKKMLEQKPIEGVDSLRIGSSTDRFELTNRRNGLCSRSEMRAPDNLLPGIISQKGCLTAAFFYFGLFVSPFGMTEYSSALGFLAVISKIARS